MTIPSSEIHTRSLTCLKLPVVHAVITWVRPWENTMLSQTDMSVVSAAVHIVTHMWWEETWTHLSRRSCDFLCHKSLLPAAAAQTAAWLIFFLSPRHDLLRARDILSFTYILNDRKVEKSVITRTHAYPTWWHRHACSSVTTLTVLMMLFSAFFPCSCQSHIPTHIFHHTLSVYNITSLEIRVWILGGESYYSFWASMSVK